MQDSGDGMVQFRVPEVTQTEIAHIILKVRDGRGSHSVSPDLFDYQRIIVQIESGYLSDIDSNGLVNFTDFLIISGNFGAEDIDRSGGDTDGDQLVGFSDFLIFSGEMTLTSTLPPASPQTLFTQFLTLSSNFGSNEASDANGDEDRGRRGRVFRLPNFGRPFLMHSAIGLKRLECPAMLR